MPPKKNRLIQILGQEESANAAGYWEAYEKDEIA